MSKLTKALTAAAGNAGSDPLYVEDVFSTNVYTGNSSTQTITNGIDLADEGGLVWTKRRSGALNNFLVTTDIATNQYLSTDLTSASGTTTTLLTPASDGFAFSSNTLVNANTASQVAWTFRKAKKFFDVVTYSSDTTSGARTLSHNLGSTPAFILVKGVNFADAWYVYHIGTGVNKYLELNLTGTGHAFTNFWGVTDSTFTVDGFLNNNGSTGKDYVAYLFASDAGGFGDDGDENIIKCGSYTGATSGTNEINLGFEPQWVMIKGTDRACDWVVFDNMRPWPTDGTTSFLRANTSGAEASNFGNVLNITPTGFSIPSSSTGNVNEYNEGYIYIAIRRPMKTPESGTEIFSPYAYSDTGLTSGSGTASNRTIINGGSNGGSGFPVDQFWHQKTSPNSSYGFHIFDRIRGQGQALLTKSYSASPAGDSANNGGFDFQEGVDVQYSGEMYYYNSNAGNRSHLSYAFKRAAKAFDIVTYTGNATAGRAVTHNLQAVPEMMFVKAHSTGNEAHWVYHKTTGNAASLLVSGDGSGYGGFWNSTTPSAATFTVSGSAAVNSASHNYVAWLWATLDGVTKVGSYSGTGSNVDVDCGFSAGARFVLIKRSNGDGDWYVWDSARGIVTGNDPYVIFAGGSVTNTDYIDPLSSGFTVTSSAPAALNASGGNYIFLAIA
jgi:hypothetical protein